MSYTMVDYVKRATEDANNADTESLKATLAKLSKIGIVDWAIAVFGKVPNVLREDGSVDMVRLFNNDFTIEHNYNGVKEVLDAQDVILVNKLFGENIWSSLYSKTQTKSEINSAVPLFLYAQKMINNIPYSAWMPDIVKYDRASFLGKAFDGMDFEVKPQFTNEEILDLRIKMYTMKTKDLAGFNLPKTNITNNEVFDKLHPMYRRMICQVWIYNAAYRNPNMILDWNDWNNVPIAIDDVTSFKSYHTSVGNKSSSLVDW